MVTTRSGKHHELGYIYELSKITASEDEARRKSLLAPTVSTESHVRKRHTASRARKTSSRTSLSKTKKAGRSTVVQASAHTKRSLRSRAVHNAATVVLEQENVNYEKKKQKIIDYIERETDKARTTKVVIKFKDFRSLAFQPVRVNWKNQYPRGFFTNGKSWKVGYQPFLSWKGPGEKAYREAFHALRDQYGPGKENQLKLEVMVNPLLPGHTYCGDGHNFHALIEPIISCATSNNNQKLASDSLKRRLTYHNGKQSKDWPNYHKLIDMSEEELSDIIRQSGRQKNNANYIMALFRNIRDENIKIRGLSAEEAYKIDKEAKDAEDWKDGLLSLDFMVGMGMQEMFDKLVSYHGIACKTAACIMCFCFGFAVFAVDTHVFRLCQWLGWLPRNCARDDAFKFFSLVIPPELHKDLHQALWHHGQLCFRCGEKTWNRTDDLRWKNSVCTLEQLGLVRFPNWEKKAKDPASSAKKEPREKKPKHPDEMVTVTLQTEKDVADAQAAGHEVHETAIDDAFGVRPDLSNIKKELKRSLYITRAEERAFRDSQKSKTITKVAKGKTKVIKKKKVTIAAEFELTTTTRTSTTTSEANQEKRR